MTISPCMSFDKRSVFANLKQSIILIILLCLALHLKNYRKAKQSLLQ